MSARELLELAAKGAGIDAEWHYSEDADYDAAHVGLWLKGQRSPDNSKYWNPLNDDGDALRLVARLNMNVHVSQGKARAWGARRQFSEHCGDDPYAATRRAIVRAAAEIGKRSEPT